MFITEMLKTFVVSFQTFWLAIRNYYHDKSRIQKTYTCRHTGICILCACFISRGELRCNLQ